jgi:hypothetical protein
MPAEFSGVLESDRNDLLDRALEAQHGEKMTQLRELNHAIEVAESAVETGRDEVRQETAIDARTFNERAKPFEAKLKPYWLRRQIEDGKEVIRVITPGGTAQVATQEQIDNGRFYADFDEYRRANPGDVT